MFVQRPYPWIAGFLCLSCASTPPPGGCPSGAFVVATDEQTASEVGILPLDGSSPQLSSGSLLGSDPALVVSAGRRFFINRTNGTIFELDACGHATAQFTSQEPGEAISDPWDVSIASDGSFWVARYLLPSALLLDRTGAPSATVDLSAFDAPGATAPNMSAVRVVLTSSGEKAFFALERLSPVPTGYSAQVPAVMAVVNAATRTLEGSVQLSGLNPQALTTQAVDDMGGIYLAAAGNWDDITETDAGIERFDTETRTTALLLDKPHLRGSPTTVAVTSDCGAAIVADATILNRTTLVVFPLKGGAATSVFGPTSGFDLRGLLWVAGQLLVGDAQFVRGVGFPVHTFTSLPGCTLAQGPDLFLPSLPAAAFSLP